MLSILPPCFLVFLINREMFSQYVKVHKKI